MEIVAVNECAGSSWPRRRPSIAARLSSCRSSSSSASSTSCSWRRCASARRRCRSWSTGLKRGDKVVTNGGLLGEIAAVEERVVHLKLADNVKVRVRRSPRSPASRASPEAEATKMNKSLLVRGRAASSASRALSLSAPSIRPRRSSTSASTCRAASTSCSRSRPRTRCAPRPTRTWRSCAARSPTTASPAVATSRLDRHLLRGRPASPAEQGRGARTRRPTTTSTAALGLEPRRAAAWSSR